MLRRLACGALSALLTATGALAAESCGPVVVIKPTTYNVTVPHPECEPVVVPNAVADAINTGMGDDPSTDGLKRWIDSVLQPGQKNANCSLVCAVIPSGARRVPIRAPDSRPGFNGFDTNPSGVARYWSDVGGPPNRSTAYYKEAFDQWGPGPGYHRWDSEIREIENGGQRSVCTLFRNWSHTTARSAQICVAHQ